MSGVRREAYARAGLLGNPSDLFEGRAIALALANFRATVTIEPAARLELVPGADDRIAYPSLREAAEMLDAYGCEDGIRLLRAALRKAVALRGGLGDLSPDDARLRFRMAYTTDIPRQVGLAGSSAIVTAALRALCDWLGHTLEPPELAEAALACETEELGITAGPMDRVAQAYEGLVAMDFRPPRGPASYRRLDPSRLPPLFLAWNPRGGTPSRVQHSDVRGRWLRGDTEVRRLVGDLVALAAKGEKVIESGDATELAALFDENFELRARVYPVSDVDRALVSIARARGAGAKLCGSGGAVIGGLRDPRAWPSLSRDYAAAGWAAKLARIQLPAAGRA
ncbi:MAG TPA: GHMP kinase [Myxococcota bacterium]|nr:GHMP kinase [Myxococcota bacterium]